MHMVLYWAGIVLGGAIMLAIAGFVVAYFLMALWLGLSLVVGLFTSLFHKKDPNWIYRPHGGNYFDRMD